MLGTTRMGGWCSQMRLCEHPGINECRVHSIAAKRLRTLDERGCVCFFLFCFLCSTTDCHRPGRGGARRWDTACRRCWVSRGLLAARAMQGGAERGPGEESGAETQAGCGGSGGGRCVVVGRDVGLVVIAPGWWPGGLSKVQDATRREFVTQLGDLLVDPTHGVGWSESHSGLDCLLGRRSRRPLHSETQ